VDPDFVLAPYQRSAIERFANWCRDRHGFVLLHRMGSGKTITAMVIMENMPSSLRRCVVSPAAILQNWATTHDDFAKIFDATAVGSRCAEQAPALGPGCASVYERQSYDGFFAVIEDAARKGDASPEWARVADMFVGAVVTFDEAHNLAIRFQMWQQVSPVGPFGLTASNCMDLLKTVLTRATRVILMTGTPIDRDFSNLTFLVNCAAGSDWPLSKHLPEDISQLRQHPDFRRVTASNFARGYLPVLPLVMSMLTTVVSALVNASVLPAVVDGIPFTSMLAGVWSGNLGAMATYFGPQILQYVSLGGAVSLGMGLALTIAMTLLGVESAMIASKQNPLGLNMERLVDRIKSHVSFFDYEFSNLQLRKNRALVGDASVLEADVRASESPAAEEAAAGAASWWGAAAGVLGAAAGAVGAAVGMGERAYKLEDWFPVKAIEARKTTGVVYSDYQGVVCLQLSAQVLKPDDALALGLVRKGQVFSQKSPEVWKQVRGAIGNLSPECRYYEPALVPAAPGSARSRFGAHFVARLRADISQEAVKRQRGFGGEKGFSRMFSCPKFERALEEILAYTTAGGARRVEPGAVDEAGRAFLPVVYTSYDVEGFQRFSAFLTACGFNHIVVHGRESDAERTERLDAAAKTAYGPVSVEFKDNLEERELGDYIAAEVMPGVREKLAQAKQAVTEAWAAVSPALSVAATTVATAAYGVTAKAAEISSATVSNAAAISSEFFVKGSEGAFAEAQKRLRASWALKGGMVVDRERAKVVKRPFGPGIHDSPPVCVLLHPTIMEGASFTHNPAIIVLEPIDGVGKQDQVYARVLRQYARPFQGVGPKVAYEASKADDFFRGPRPVKRVVQLWANFDMMRYYDSLVQVWIKSFAYTWPLVMGSVGDFLVTSSFGPDAQTLADNDATDQQYREMSELLQKLDDKTSARGTCGVGTGADAKVSQKCDTWTSDAAQGTCRSTALSAPYARIHADDDPQPHSPKDSPREPPKDSPAGFKPPPLAAPKPKPTLPDIKVLAAQMLANADRRYMARMKDAEAAAAAAAAVPVPLAAPVQVPVQVPVQGGGSGSSSSQRRPPSPRARKGKSRSPPKSPPKSQGSRRASPPRTKSRRSPKASPKASPKRRAAATRSPTKGSRR
jgi:hypothetical protein